MTEPQQIVQEYSVIVGSETTVPWYPLSKVVTATIFEEDATTVHFWVDHPIWPEATEAPLQRTFYVVDTGMEFPAKDVVEVAVVGELNSEGGHRVWQLIRREPGHTTN